MDISFIIPLYNQVGYTKSIWDALQRTVRRVDWEVIFVDDQSSDETPAFLASIAGDPRVTVIRNEHNLGFAGTNNRGVAAAKGRFLGLLNNDLELPDGWFEPMWKLLQTPGVGGVGNIQFSPHTGLIDHAGIFFDLDGLPAHARKNRKALPKGEFADWNAATAACFFIPRDVFAGVGGFDEGYENGMEDVHLCVRIRRAGYRILVSHAVPIGHYVSVSRKARRERDVRNTARFVERCAAITRAWGQEEWPREYLQLYARHWWRFNATKFCRAVKMRLAQRGGRG